MQCCNTALLHYKLKNIAIPAYNTPISRCYTANRQHFFLTLSFGGRGRPLVLQFNDQ